MDQNPDSIHTFHFHIHWSKKEHLDWQSFDNRVDATLYALEVAHPGEMFTIEQFPATCPRCGPKVTSANKVNFAEVCVLWQIGRAILETIVIAAGLIISDRLISTRAAFLVLVVGGVLLLIAHEGSRNKIKTIAIKYGASPEGAKRAVFGTAVVGGLVLGVGLFWMYSNKVRVYAPFRLAYEEYKSVLGNPIANVVTNPNGIGGSEDEFEHAAILFLDKRYVLYDDQRYFDITEREYPSKTYFNLFWLRQHFPPPPFLGPPRGSTAQEWEKNPSDWKTRVGYTKWYCDFKSLSYQDYERGRILGLFVEVPFPTNNDQRGTMYVLFNREKKWESVLGDRKDTPLPSDATCRNFTGRDY